MVHWEELESSRDWIELAGTSIELFGVAVIVAGVVLAAYGFVRGLLRRSNRMAAGRGQVLAEAMKSQVGRTLLLGLEILVAADIIETVALEPTLESIAALGLLVIVRTFLSWSIILEIEQRWPWQKESQETEPAEQPREVPASAMPQEA
jgi:uncharacterized membrane protein